MRATPKYPPRPLSRSHIHRMLHNDYYVGIVTYEGSKRRGRHEPIIDQATFDRVQGILEARAKGGNRSQKHHHYLKGLLKCPLCHHGYIYGRHRGHGGAVYEYYGCMGRRKGVCPDGGYAFVPRVELEIGHYYRQVRLTARQRRAVSQCIDEQTQPLVDATQQERARHTVRLKELDLEQERLLRLYYKDGVTAEVVATERERIKQERTTTQRSLNALADEAKETTQPAAQAKILLSRLGTTYVGAPPHIRRLINRAVFNELLISRAPIKGDRQRVGVVGVRRPEIDAERLARALLRHSQDVARAKVGKEPLIEAQWKIQEAKLIQVRDAKRQKP